MHEWFGFDHKIVATTAIVVSSGVAAYATYRLFRQNRQSRVDNKTYESQKLLHEYLVFHYGLPHEVLKWDFGPNDALDFPKRCADLCRRHCSNQSGIPSRALDIGCAVGRSTFELASDFSSVIGIDFSQSFIDSCNRLKADGLFEYFVNDEGDIVTPLTARVDKDINRQRVQFQCGDACNLPLDLGQFGCVLAANLVDRLPSPVDFLSRLPSLVAKGGILVITSPYTWLTEWTPKCNWLGGYYNIDKKPVSTLETLQKTLEPEFELLEQQNMPFLIRETARKNQWTVANATVWRKR